MARTPEPAALKLLKGRGNGKDSGGRSVVLPPAFGRDVPQPPAWLSPEARAEWDRVVLGMARLDLLKPEDRATLSTYCETWATYVEAVRDVRERGLTVTRTVTTKDGRTWEQETPNPSVLVARAEGKELRAWATHYGLTPSSESGLAAVNSELAGGDGWNPFATGNQEDA